MGGTDQLWHRFLGTLPHHPARAPAKTTVPYNNPIVRACVLACLRACVLACLRACVLACEEEEKDKEGRNFGKFVSAARSEFQNSILQQTADRQTYSRQTDSSAQQIAGQLSVLCVENSIESGLNCSPDARI